MQLLKESHKKHTLCNAGSALVMERQWKDTPTITRMYNQLKNTQHHIKLAVNLSTQWMAETHAIDTKRVSALGFKSQLYSNSSGNL